MKTGVFLTSGLLLAAAALARLIDRSYLLSTVVAFWTAGYLALGYAWPRASHAWRWTLVVSGVAAGAAASTLAGQPVGTATIGLASGAALLFFGWASGVDALRGSPARRGVPARDGRPGTWSAAFCGSLVLAAFALAPGGGIGARTGLVVAFLVVCAGFASWECGRENPTPPARTGRRRSRGGKALRALAGSGLLAAAFLLFAEVLPLAALALNDLGKPLAIDQTVVDLPDLADLDDLRFRQRPPTPEWATGGPPTRSETADPEEASPFRGGVSQNVTGNPVDRLPPSDGAPSGASAASGATATPGGGTRPAPETLPAAASPAPFDLGAGPSGRSVTRTAFWNVPENLVGPLLVVAAFAGLFILGLLLFLRTFSSTADPESSSAIGPIASRDEPAIPSYLRDLFRRCAECGLEKERGQTLREFVGGLQTTRSLGHELDSLVAYHYAVAFANATRDPARERHFKKFARKLPLA